MAHIQKKSVLPIYFVGFVWVLWAVFGSLHRPTDYIMAALVSIAAYFLGKILFPDRGYEIPDEEKASPQPEPQAQAKQQAASALEEAHKQAQQLQEQAQQQAQQEISALRAAAAAKQTQAQQMILSELV